MLSHPTPRFSRTRPVILTLGMILLMVMLVFLTPAPAPFLKPAASPRASTGSVLTAASSTPDFTIIANPSSLTLDVGTTKSSTITLTSQGGFSGTVYLSATSFLLKTSLSSTSVPLLTIATSTLTVTVPSNVPPGDYFVFVDASGGCTLFHDAFIPVTVVGPDFTISTSKTQMTIIQGASDTSTITLASKNGFAGTVPLIPLGFPLTATLASMSLTLTAGGTATTTLTVFVPPTTEPGNYTVSVLAGGAGKTPLHSTEVLVKVPGPTFDLSANPEFLKLTAGGASNSSTITVRPSGGFTGTVTLSFTSFPTGLTITLVPTNVPAGGASTLTVSAPPGTPLGDYFVSIHGISGLLSRYAEVFVHVKGPDFQITADPFFLTVVAGSTTSCTSSISVTPIEGFTGTVNLVATTSSSLTFSLSSSSVPVPGNSILTVSAPSKIAAGFYSVDVNGTSTSPARTHTTTVEIQVIAPDFSLSSNPTSLTINAGQSDKSTISVSAEFGFSGSVALTATSFDPGLTASISPSPISVSQTATLTVAVAATTISGDYSVNVTGTSGLLVHSIFISVTVIGPDFSLSANPKIISVNEGASQTSIITVTPSNGFTGSVDLFATPSSFESLNATIQPATVSASGTAILSVNSTIPGQYTVDVEGISGSLFHDVIVTVTVLGPDFTLSASPPTLTITAGSSQTSTITVNPSLGFTNPIDLTATAPPGLTASLSITPITPSQNSILTINVDARTSPGPYSVDVQGTSGPLAHHVTVAVNVAGFTVTANPDTLTIDQGGSQVSTITVTYENGFTGTVQLTPTASPGLTPMLSPSSFGGSGTSQITIAASGTIAPAAYTVNVTGTSGLLAQNTTITVTVPVPNFTISPSSPVTVNCSPSIYCHQTITVTAINGFSGVVTFSTSTVSVLYCYPLTSVTGSGTSDLSCSSPNPGDFTVTVTAMSGSLSHTTAAITFHVTAPADFTILASPTAIGPLDAGISDSTVTITVSALNGFSGVVGLTTNPSAGLTATLNPISVTGSGTSKLTVSAAAAGTYTVTVTGKSGSLSRTTASITVTVVDFTITASSPSGVVAGQSATSTITITAKNGFAATVSLSDPTLPTGLTCTAIYYRSVSLPPSPASATLSCSATAAGTFTITITGTSGQLAHTTTATFTFTDFTVVATSPAAVAAGQSATSTITVTAKNGFTGTVSLSRATPPAGLTCAAIASNAVTLPPSPSTATLSCVSTTAGPFSVTITAASGGLTHDAQAKFTYVAPDITLTPSSTSLSFNTGSSATATIAIAATNGFASTVALTVSAPSGVTCTLNPSTVQPSGIYTATATVTCTSSTAGDYTVTVTASGGAIPHQATFTVHVTTVTPAAPAPTILGLDPTVFYAIVGVVIAIIVIAGVTIFLRQRKP